MRRLPLECPSCHDKCLHYQEHSKYRRGTWYACDKCRIKVLYKDPKDDSKSWHDYVYFKPGVSKPRLKDPAVPDPTVQGPSPIYEDGRPPAPPLPQVDPEDMLDLSKEPAYMNYGGRGKPLECGNLKGRCVYFCHTDSWISRQINRFRRPINPYRRNIYK